MPDVHNGSSPAVDVRPPAPIETSYLESLLSEESPLYVARPEDVTAIVAHWDAANAGSPRMVRLQAPFGGGRRALMGEVMRTLRGSTEDPLLWRVTCSDQEDGAQWMVRMYGSLIAHATSDILRRGKIEMVLNGQVPNQTKRVQEWFQHFVAALKESKTDPKTGQVELRIPQDNPLIGLVEVIVGIARKMPVVLELQSPYVVHSVLVAQFLECLLDEARRANARLLAVIYDEPESEVAETSHPAPLRDFYQRRADGLHAHLIAPWGAEDTGRYLASRKLQSDAERIAGIASGRPGFIAELVDILVEGDRLGDDLSSVTLASLVPMQVDQDELDIPEAPAAEGERKHASEADAPMIAYLAALVGQVFPSSLVAEMGGFERESVDDLLDAMEDLFEEVQFSESLGTWLYKFKRGSWREGILEHNDTTEGHELARRVGLFMERFLVPRGQAFVTRTARIYAEHSAPNRAMTMRAVALTRDNPDAWIMAYEMIKYFDEVPWTDPMRRSVMTTLLDHLVSANRIGPADRVHAEATTWATEKEDRDLQSWLLLTGSKLDARRQDFFRARDRARDALIMAEALGNRARMAEIWAHLSTVELQDGKPEEAVAAADKSMEFGSQDQADGKKVVLPAILSQSEIVRGVIARRNGAFDQAIDHFRRANEVAGTTGLAPLALESGLALGEALLAHGQIDKAREVLQRVIGATRQLRAPLRERAASELLAQAEGAARNYEAALQLAQRALQISQQMRIEQAVPVDLYHVGFFHLAQNKGAAALPFFKEARERLKANATHPILKDLHYYTGLASLQAGDMELARESLRRSLQPLQAAREVRKLVTALDQLAAIEHRRGDAETAKKLLNDAINIARQADLKDEKKALKKRLESIS
jgi:tetratricopeptide (TPR) repeat protein